MAAYCALVRWLRRRRSAAQRSMPRSWRAWISRRMVRPLTTNRSAKAVSVIPGSSRQAWAMASRRSAGLPGRLDRARPGMPAGRSSRLASAAAATAARGSVADAGVDRGCTAAVTADVHTSLSSREPRHSPEAPVRSSAACCRASRDGGLVLQPQFSESLALSPVTATSARLVSAPPQRPAQDPVGIRCQPPGQHGQEPADLRHAQRHQQLGHFCALSRPPRPPAPPGPA
jgi:hypothetical protein